MVEEHQLIETLQSKEISKQVKITYRYVGFNDPVGAGLTAGTPGLEDEEEKVEEGLR